MNAGIIEIASEPSLGADQGSMFGSDALSMMIAPGSGSANETGVVCHELKVPTHPEDVARILKNRACRLVRIGLEAGPMSQWLFSGLAEAGLPVICIETRHTKAFLKAQVNKTDRNDARGIAQMMRVNLFRPVHVKTLTSQKRRALLTARKLLQAKAIAIENDIRGLLRNFGLKVGVVGTIGFEARIRDLVDGMPELADIIAPLLAARRKLREEFSRLHRKVLDIVRADTVCNRLMTIPGVGPVTALAFTSSIDVPARFRNSRAMGPALGLTPMLYLFAPPNGDRSVMARTRDPAADSCRLSSAVTAVSAAPWRRPIGPGGPG